MLETMGAEKLVPTLILVSLVYEAVLGTVKPVLLNVSMERRHAPEVLTQLPAGAATPHLTAKTAVPHFGANIA